MKHFIPAFVLSVLLFAGSALTFADNKDTERQIGESTVASLLEGLNSDNLGLKSSSAYLLGELKISDAVIPLLKILHNDDNEELRISAALALYKIGTPIAIYAVKQAGRFDNSERVCKLAKNFYAEYLRAQLISTTKNLADNFIAHNE
jgi:hypothetical protein